MSKKILKQRTNGCDPPNPFCSRSSLHLRCVSDKFMSVISYTGAYCALLFELWEQGIQIELSRLKVVFLVALISVNTI